MQVSYVTRLVKYQSTFQILLTLLVKYYIYKTQYFKQKISFVSCKNAIMEYKNIEEEIVRTKNKLSQHQVKWSDLLQNEKKHRGAQRIIVTQRQ